MGIQDKIYDVQVVLELSGDSSAIDAFERVIDFIGDLERQVEGQTRLLHDLAAGMRALDMLKKMGV